MAKKHFVAVDIGTSETRVSADGNVTFQVPNNCVILTEPTPTSFAAGNEVLSSLEAVIEGLDSTPVVVLYGEMASRYSITNLRPSPLEAKYKQRINLVSIILGAALVRLEKGNGPVELHIALPPIEVNKAREALKGSLNGEYTVEFPKLGRKCKIRFEDIFCYEESRMAGEAFMSQLTPEHREGMVLSVDIGAGTTDLALFLDGVFYERSAKTYKIGGNTAREYLIDTIVEEYDYELPAAEAEIVIATGMLKLGNKKVFVVEYVNEAKRRFAESLVEQIQQYFRAVGVPVQTVNVCCVSGGGSMAGGSQARSAVSYVTDSLQAVCPGMDVVEYNGNPRMANLDGLCLVAKQAQNPPVIKSNLGGDADGEEPDEKEMDGIMN